MESPRLLSENADVNPKDGLQCSKVKRSIVQCAKRKQHLNALATIYADGRDGRESTLVFHCLKYQMIK
jgi:hypothetical protein